MVAGFDFYHNQIDDNADSHLLAGLVSQVKVFPVKKGKVRVGIHGIEGCFTHESVVRFCEEFGIDQKNIEFKYLVEAKRVIKATYEGKVDRGVFCIANSGSGAYVETALIVGKYPFEVLEKPLFRNILI